MLLLAVPVAVLVGLAVPRHIMLAGVGYVSALFVGANVLGVQMSGIVGGLIGLMRGKRPTVKIPGLSAYMTALVVGGLLALTAAIWSTPSPLPYITAVRWLSLAALTLVTVNMIMADGIASVGKLLALLAPLALAQAISTVIFRVDPNVEATYYASDLGAVFLRNTGRALTTAEGYNNVVELERAGGFLFVSVNRAALAMGIMLLAYLAYATIARKRWPKFVALSLAGAIIATGSKTALVLLLALPLFAFLLSRAASSRTPAGRIGVVLAGALGLAVGTQVFVSTADEFVQASEQTLQPRVVLWSEALRAIGEDPLFGLGFGGWIERWDAGGVAAGFSSRPAHNWFLQAWLDGGLGFVVANVALAVVALVMLVRAVRVETSRAHRLGFALAGSAFLWAIIHGMGDNSPIIGDPHSSVFLMVCAALLLTAPTIAEPQPSSELAMKKPRRALVGIH